MNKIEEPIKQAVNLCSDRIGQQGTQGSSWLYFQHVISDRIHNSLCHRPTIPRLENTATRHICSNVVLTCLLLVSIVHFLLGWGQKSIYTEFYILRSVFNKTFGLLFSLFITSLMFITLLPFWLVKGFDISLYFWRSSEIFNNGLQACNQ